MNWRRIAQRILMALANESREVGERGYFLFWRTQRRIQTQQMRDEDRQIMADAMTDGDLQEWRELTALEKI